MRFSEAGAIEHALGFRGCDLGAAQPDQTEGMGVRAGAYSLADPEKVALSLSRVRDRSERRCRSLDQTGMASRGQCPAWTYEQHL